MRRIFKTLLLMAIVACGVNFILFTTKVDAIVNPNVPIQEVDDVTNFPYPDSTTISYDYERISFSSVTIKTAGQLKAILHCEIDSIMTGNIWLSRDNVGKNIIGEISKFSGNLTEVSWFLESGTYYINTNISGYPYELDIALLFEKSKATELDSTTSFESSTVILHNNTVRGFLTNENPADYYSFDLTKEALVTMKYSFDTSTAINQYAGHCGLYDTNELFLKEGIYTKQDEGSQEYTYKLEPGTYFIKLNGLSGNTTLSIEPMYYDISLTPVTNNNWTKKYIRIDINTSIDYSEIIVLYKDVKASLIDSSAMWSKISDAYVVLDGESFKARKSGIYSVRITDKYGNHTMQKIEISNIDVTVPTIKGVTDSKSYKTSVTPTWTDTQSGINKGKTTLNGKVISSGTKITKEGKYILKVYDMVGNYKTIEFCIDHTAPTAGVENGKAYTDSVTLKFRDNVSGIKKVVVDGAEVSTTNITMYCYLEGEYTVELWDNAGNYKKFEFTIKDE